MKTPLIIAAALGLTACQTSSNPADGGFINGVSGLASGTYQQRIDNKQTAVAAGQARTAELQAELAAVTKQWSGWKLKLINTRSQLSNSGVVIPASLQARLNETLATTPGGNSDEARLASLQAAIAQARALAAELESLSA